MKPWQEIKPPRGEPAKKEKTRRGLLWPRGLRVNGWSGQIPVRRRCPVCAVALTKNTKTITVGEAVVTGVYIRGGRICDRHVDFHMPAPCTCGEVLFVWRGKRHRRGKLVEAVEYVTKKGQVVRECPGCQGRLST